MFCRNQLTATAKLDINIKCARLLHSWHTEVPFCAQAATFHLCGDKLPLRMMLQNVFHPLLGADVGINLCSKDAFVAEHLLHYAQVGTVFNQMGCKGVAEGVGRYFLFIPKASTVS